MAQSRHLRQPSLSRPRAARLTLNTDALIAPQHLVTGPSPTPSPTPFPSPLMLDRGCAGLPTSGSAAPAAKSTAGGGFPLLGRLRKSSPAPPSVQLPTPPASPMPADRRLLRQGGPGCGLNPSMYLPPLPSPVPVQPASPGVWGDDPLWSPCGAPSSEGLLEGRRRADRTVAEIAATKPVDVIFDYDDEVRKTRGFWA